MDIEKLEILDRLRELTQADLDEMDYDKVWIDYEDGTGEWALVCNGYIYSIDTLEGAGFEFAEYMRGEKLEPNGYKVYRCPPDGAALEAAIALSTLLAENEELKSKLYDGEGVNLVDYWMQQAQIEGVDAAPTIDAVPVVRCRECKFYREFRTKRYSQLMRLCYRMGKHDMEYPVKPDDFCSYGQRKGD